MAQTLYLVGLGSHNGELTMPSHLKNAAHHWHHFRAFIQDYNFRRQVSALNA